MSRFGEALRAYEEAEWARYDREMDCARFRETECEEDDDACNQHERDPGEAD